MNSIIALIDADELAFKAAASCEKTIYQIYDNTVADAEYQLPVISFYYKKEADSFLKANPDKYVSIPGKVYKPIEEGILNLRSMLKSIKDALNTPEYSLYLSGDNNFRKDIATIVPYKGHRGEKPKLLAELKQYLVDEELAIVTDNQEADDALGIMSNYYHKQGKYEPVVVSQDKDLNMIARYHYNLSKGLFWNISPEEADKFFYLQLLVGDPTDNIPGIYKMGFITAEKILKDIINPVDLYKKVRIEYIKALNGGKNDKFRYDTHGLSVDEVILEIGRLLWIRRDHNELWSPPL